MERSHDGGAGQLPPHDHRRGRQASRLPLCLLSGRRLTKCGRRMGSGRAQAVKKRRSGGEFFPDQIESVQYPSVHRRRVFLTLCCRGRRCGSTCFSRFPASAFSLSSIAPATPAPSQTAEMTSQQHSNITEPSPVSPSPSPAANPPHQSSQVDERGEREGVIGGSDELSGDHGE